MREPSKYLRYELQEEMMSKRPCDFTFSRPARTRWVILNSLPLKPERPLSVTWIAWDMSKNVKLDKF